MTNIEQAHMILALGSPEAQAELVEEINREKKHVVGAPDAKVWAELEDALMVSLYPDEVAAQRVEP